MIKQTFFLSLFNILIVLGCNAMDAPVIHLEQTQKAIVKSVPNFLPLPIELNAQIYEYIIDMHGFMPQQKIKICRKNLKKTLQTINSLALLNKQMHTFINDDTDNLIKRASSNFNVSNAFIARALRTKAAGERYFWQNKLFQLCVHHLNAGAEKLFIENLKNLESSFPIKIDWDFTYLYKCCLFSSCKEYPEHKCLTCNFSCRCEPHCKNPELCDHIALKTSSYTPLMIACTQFLSNTEPIDFLIKKGANLNSLTKCKKNAPMINVIRYTHMNRYPFVKIFLDQPSFDIHHQDDKGNTYLIWLASLGKDCLAPEIKTVLDKGADPEVRNYLGKSALDYIDAHYHQRIFSILNAAIEKKHTKK